MKIGFTGSRYGMSQSQKTAFCHLIRWMHNHYGDSMEFEEFHHGDCKGADAEAHEWIRGFDKNIPIHIHPPNKDDWRAFCKSRHKYKPKPFYKRNEDIVDKCNLIIAVPYSIVNQSGGTWHTIKYARRIEVPMVILW